MKILDILFVVFNLYNFVCLFKLRKRDKKEIKMIKEQKVIECIADELKEKGYNVRLLRRIDDCAARYIMFYTDKRYFVTEISETIDLRDMVRDIPELMLNVGGLVYCGGVVSLMFHIFLEWTKDITNNICSEIDEKKEHYPQLTEQEVMTWINNNKIIIIGADKYASRVCQKKLKSSQNSLKKTDMSSYRKAKTIRTEIQFMSENMWR